MEYLMTFTDRFEAELQYASEKQKDITADPGIVSGIISTWERSESNYIGINVIRKLFKHLQGLGALAIKELGKFIQ